jgi:hypothetical protein
MLFGSTPSLRLLFFQLEAARHGELLEAYLTAVLSLALVRGNEVLFERTYVTG